MPHPISISSGQWWDVPFETLCQKMADFGYDGLELACWGDHFDVERALSDDAYLPNRRAILEKYGLKCYAISNHNVGQAICDVLDEKNKFALPAHIWGDGKEDGVRRRAVGEYAERRPRRRQVSAYLSSVDLPAHPSGDTCFTGVRT